MYFAELCTRFTQLFYDLLIEIIFVHINFGNVSEGGEIAVCGLQVGGSGLGLTYATLVELTSWFIFP